MIRKTTMSVAFDEAECMPSSMGKRGTTFRVAKSLLKGRHTVRTMQRGRRYADGPRPADCPKVLMDLGGDP